MHQLDLDYVHMYHKNPAEVEDLIYFLGDRYEHTRTWSAASGRNPTYRRNSGFYLHRASLRIMTPCDKLASMGWPVTEEAAEAMGTRPLPVVDVERSASLVGNAMHLTQIAVILLLGLSCFGRLEHGPLLDGDCHIFRV